MSTALEYALDCVSEEASEIIQAIGKIKRFGLRDKRTPTHHPNIDILQAEILDLIGALRQLNIELFNVEENPIRIDIEPAIQAKIAKIHRYSELSITNGCLSEPLSRPPGLPSGQ